MATKRAIPHVSTLEDTDYVNATFMGQGLDRMVLDWFKENSTALQAIGAVVGMLYGVVGIVLTIWFRT